MGVEYRQGLAGHQFAGGAAEVADRRQAIVRSADGKLGRPRKLPPLWHRRCTPGVRFEYRRISNGDQFGWGTVTIVNSIPRSPPLSGPPSPNSGLKPASRGSSPNLPQSHQPSRCRSMGSTHPTWRQAASGHLRLRHRIGSLQTERYAENRHRDGSRTTCGDESTLKPCTAGGRGDQMFHAKTDIVLLARAIPVKLHSNTHPHA
jgi:hypothetical protein